MVGDTRGEKGARSEEIIVLVLARVRQNDESSLINSVVKREEGKNVGERNFDVRLPEKGSLNSHDARPVHLIIGGEEPDSEIGCAQRRLLRHTRLAATHRLVRWGGVQNEVGWSSE